MTVTINEGERIDDLQRNGLKLIQKTDGFCFGMDAVLLSGFARVEKNEKVADLGTGTGIIPILLSAKTPGIKFYGLEIQKEMADLASRSVALNNLGEKIEIINGDLRDKELIKQIGKVNVVTANPPYMRKESGLKNAADTKTIARHELCCTLRDLSETAAALLNTKGRLYLIHRPMRLAEIIVELKKVKLEPKRIKFVHPFIEKPATMVLIEAIKEGGADLKVEKPLIIYENKGKYTEEIYDIYGY